MKVIQGDNVRDLYVQGMEFLQSCGEDEDSRVGTVIVSPVPVCSVYENPQQRVLLNPARDANPFFHFMEGIWMLSGFNDGAFLDLFVHDFTKRFADHPGTILHGAYGFRWRKYWDVDQIQEIINILKGNPNDRRAVLTMWDPTQDLNTSAHNDIPCNTNIFFRINDHKLDMMINCRSNDIIWGAYGANAVHMPMLMEYIATSLGIEMGRMYQNSWNFHAYTDVFYNLIRDVRDRTWNGPYEKNLVPLVSDPTSFLSDCELFITDAELGYDYKNKIFGSVAAPMIVSHQFYKKKRFKEALKYAGLIEAEDWRLACTQWIERRIAIREMKQDGGEISYGSDA